MEYTGTNKLISKFVNDCEMGVYSEDGDFIHSSICGVDADSAFYRWEDMKFHTSWDWLMPVGKKIYDYMQAYDRPNENAVCQGDWLETNIGCAIREYDMAKAHENIIEFINWYNSNLPTPSIA